MKWWWRWWLHWQTGQQSSSLSDNGSILGLRNLDILSWYNLMFCKEMNTTDRHLGWREVPTTARQSVMIGHTLTLLLLMPFLLSVSKSTFPPFHNLVTGMIVTSTDTIRVLQMWKIHQTDRQIGWRDVPPRARQGVRSWLPLLHPDICHDRFKLLQSRWFAEL